MTLVERARGFYVDGLIREKDSAQVTYETLADKYESARLAKVWNRKRKSRSELWP